MDEKFISKKKLHLTLNDTGHASDIFRALSSDIRLQILRTLTKETLTIGQLAERFYLPISSMSLHINVLKDAGLITVIPQPGVHGTRKVCGIAAKSVDIDFFARDTKFVQKPSVYVNMPVGNYSDCEITPPCGIATANSYLYQEDSPYGFYSPDHINASLLWMTSGFLEYHFPTEAIIAGNVKSINFSFEICSEAPGYNNNWPSDIILELNHKYITTIHTFADYGGRRGVYNPSWWNDANTQYGEYKNIRITNDGCYMQDTCISDETISTLSLSSGYYFTFTLKVDTAGKNAGGMNLFGKYFGDYAQDIVMKVDYE